MNGKYGTEASLKHHPANMLAPFFLATLRNSRVSLVFPDPASPEMKMVLPFPSEAEFRNDSSSLSSFSLPVKAGSDKTLSVNLVTPGIYWVTFIVRSF